MFETFAGAKGFDIWDSHFEFKSQNELHFDLPRRKILP
jgi:hypothetical protein